MPRDGRREHVRVRKAISFRIVPGGVANEATIDISLGGLLMESSKFYNISQKLSIELIIPDQDHIRCDARVAWIYPRTIGSTNYKVGLQFLNMQDADKKRLEEYIL